MDELYRDIFFLKQEVFQSQTVQINIKHISFVMNNSNVWSVMDAAVSNTVSSEAPQRLLYIGVERQRFFPPPSRLDHKCSFPL